MPVTPLFVPTETVAFGRALYLAPSELPSKTQAHIARIVGTSNNRLQISEQAMLEHFRDENTSAVGFVWCGSSEKPGWAFGSLQYYDWLKIGEPQMWVTDLCRMGTKETHTSPIATLLDMFTATCLAHHVSELWLMVDMEDRTIADILCHVYESYGFQRTHECRKLKSILMRRSLRV